MEKGISPEERLLRLIRKGTKPKDPTEKKDEGISKAGREKGIPDAKRPERQKAWLGKRWQKRKTIKVINQCLLLLLLALGSYFLFDLITSKPGEILVETPGPEDVPKAQSVSRLKPYKFYVKQIGKRELFTPLIPEEGGKPEAVVTLKDLAANLTLIGIVESDEKLQAIIEDKKQRKNYFLYKGAFIGEIEIKDVLEGKVILGYGDEELELSL